MFKFTSTSKCTLSFTFFPFSSQAVTAVLVATLSTTQPPVKSFCDVVVAGYFTLLVQDTRIGIEAAWFGNET